MFARPLVFSLEMEPPPGTFIFNNWNGVYKRACSDLIQLAPRYIPYPEIFIFENEQLPGLQCMRELAMISHRIEIAATARIRDGIATGHFYH